MYGPKPKGFWTSVLSPASIYRGMIPGKRYCVRKELTDFDRDRHPVGESWVFLGHSFHPHDDGMSFFVSLDGEQEWHIRLQWVPEEQGDVLDRLEHYFERV